MLELRDGSTFAQGACTYRYGPVTEQDRTPRIIVPVQIEGIPTEAMVDTGGVYLVFDPQLADLLGLNPSSALDTDVLRIRGSRYSGNIYRLSLTLLAQEGQSVRLEATTFVPNLHPGEVWGLPSFLGFFGCLERMRFAVDPVAHTFYFGSLEQG